MARTKRNVWARALVFALGLGTCGLLTSGVAHAQTAIASDTSGLSPGIRAGNLELHPEFAAKGGYDTNVYKADGEGLGRESREEGAGILTLTAGMSLTTLSQLRQTQGEGTTGQAQPKLELKAAGFASFFQYIGLQNPVTGREQKLRGSEFDVSGDFHIMPHRPVSLVLGGSWRRNARPFTASTGEQAGVNSEKNDERKSQAFDVIVPRARLMFESRGGVLTAFTGYRPGITLYEGQQFEYLSSFYHDVDAGIGWRFFPSTSLLYDMTYTYVDYYKLDDVDRSTIQVLLEDSWRLRARMGVNGAFTRKLSLRVLGGYAVGVFAKQWLDDFEEPVGEVVLTYRFGSADKSLAEGGYLRNVTPAAVGGYMVSDRGFARVKLQFYRLFALSSEVGVSHVKYGRQIAPSEYGPNGEVTAVRALEADGVTEKRTDLRIDAILRAEYRALSWLGIVADFFYQNNITDFDFLSSVLTPDPADYQTFQVSAGLRASY